MQTLPFDVLDAPDPLPDFINLVDDQEEGDPKGASQVLASAASLAEKECVLSHHHGRCDGQVQPASSGKSLPPQHGGCDQQPEQAPSGQPLPPQHHGGCAQPEIPRQHGGCPLPPQHGGSDGQLGQAPSGKSLPEQPEQAPVGKPPQHGGCAPQHGGCDGQSEGARVGKPLPQHQAPSGKSLDLQHGGCAQPEIPRQHGGCAQPPEQAPSGKPLPPQHGGWDGQPGQDPSGTSLPGGCPEQPKQASSGVRAAPSGHSCPLQADPPNMGIPPQTQPEFSKSNGEVVTYDVEKLEDAQVQGFFPFCITCFLTCKKAGASNSTSSRCP